MTERDTEILKHVYRHRFLRSDHITALVPGSRQRIRRRLQLLFHHGYLERPRCQVDYYQSGSRRMAYGIGNKGAAWLKRELALPYHRLDWGQKNRVGRLFLEHALLVSDVMVALESASRQRPGVHLLTPDEIELRNDVTPKRRPFGWKVTIRNRLKVGLVPDRVFGLEFADNFGRKQRTWFCLEADRGTMPVMRANLSKTSFHRKLFCYEATWKQNLHRTNFGWQRFRVLTVTSGPNRVASLSQAASKLEHARGLFLFADAESLREHRNFFAMRWRTHRAGTLVPLLS